jgi:hypothetical protein
VSKPGRILLTWTLVHRADVASVFVNRGPAARCPNAPVPSRGFYAGTRIGDLTPRSRQVDPTERDMKHYCYAVFTLDAAGNWASPVPHLARNPGDHTPPASVTAVTVTPATTGVAVSWTDPRGAAEVAVIRGAAGGACPEKPADGQRIGGRTLRSSQSDPTAKPGTAYCYAVFAYDQAGNRSQVATKEITLPRQATSASPPAPSGSGGSSLPGVVGLIGGGALLVAALAYATLRLLRREWEWHARTGYGIRDLVSIDVRDYSPLGLVIPGIIGVCIAGAVLVFLLSL